jgi:hypothetical protein
MVDSGYADTEYPKFDGAFQTSNNERAGYCPRVSGDVYGCNDSLVKRLFYRLPASYAGKTILSAQFQISLTNGWNTTPHNISLYRMTAGISTSTNWSNQPNGSGWSGAVLQQTRSLGAEQACTSTTRNSIFDATESVRWAATNSKTEITFGIKNANESDYTHHKRFCENALLKVNWNRAPSQPAVSDLQLAPGGACVFGTARPYSDTRPVLKATLRDPDHLAASGDAEDLKAEFRVQWTPPGGTLQTATFQTGNQASGTPWGWSFNTVNLTFPQNVVVSWDVRAFDGTVWGPWSSDGAANPCEFVYDTTVPTPPLVSSPEFLRSDLVDCSQYDDPAWRDGVGVATIFTFDSAATDVIEYRYGINTNPSASNVLRPSSDGGPVNLPWLANMEGPNFITVQAYDRASKSSAIATCTFRVSAGQPAVAEWGLADVGGDGEPVSDGRGNAPATAHGSVVFGVPGPGGPADRAIQLPGTEDSYLDTETAGLVDTGKSFSVSAWVRLTDTSRSQVIVSQDGSGEPGFRLGFNKATNKWSFAVPVTDVESLGEWKVEAGTPTSLWTHLLAVYDAQVRELRLYVDDNAVVTSVRRSAWRSRGAVQIGRVLSKAGYTGYFKGELADVALFNRVLVPAEVGQQIQAVPARRGYWPLNTATGTTSENLVSGGQVLTLSGATVVAADPLGDPPVIPMMGSGELYLDGVDDYASTASSVVATDGSFTVTARVRLASPDSGPAMAVLSQKGASQDSGFIVRRNDANRWELALPQADEPGGEVDTAFDDQAPPLGEQQGQLLALVYNGFTNDAVLYVDGQLAASAKVNHALAWNATGGFQVGRAFIDGVFSEYLAGSIDDVRVYAGALDPTTVQQLNQLIELPDL